MLAVGVLRWNGVVSSESKTAIPSDVVQRGLGDGLMLMDARRTMALSGIVMASTTGLPRSMHYSCPEDGFVEDGGDDF